MKRSTRCDYALRAVLELSHYYNNKLIRVSDLSKAQDIPNKYLEQIMLQLKKAGYVESRKGPSGGYALAKPPDEIFWGISFAWLINAGSFRNIRIPWLICNPSEKVAFIFLEYGPKFRKQ